MNQIFTLKVVDRLAHRSTLKAWSSHVWAVALFGISESQVVTAGKCQAEAKYP